MAFDERLADRVRDLLAGQRGLAEKRMFGGLAFLINGNMSVGILGAELIVRLAPQDADGALREPGARVFDLTGRTMKGWVMVGAGGIARGTSLAKWVRRGATFAASLPAK